MADYVIGDIQGCYDPFMRLLELIQFDTTKDRLWLVGDLVNRGPASLAVLRSVYQLSNQVVLTLGNHDLYLLARLFLSDSVWQNTDDTIHPILNSPDAETLGHWLRVQPLLYRDSGLGVVMVHAGIAPMWSIDEAMQHASEVESQLAGHDFRQLLGGLYGDEPTSWSETLKSLDRWRCIINYFTRMRFCDTKGGLCLGYKGTIEAAPKGLVPWFAHPKRVPWQETIVFGHWAALGVLNPVPNVYGLDTGCVWGQTLTAMCLQEKKFFSVRAS